MPLTCPIAIVGMACRYPEADTVDALFENALAQRRAFRKIPAQRLSGHYFDPTGRAADRAYVDQAAVLNGFSFDRNWFRVSQPSYDVTDLTHWLALTVAKETIESVRFRKSGMPLSNEAVRVVVGNTLTGEFSRASLMRLRWPYVRGVVERQLREETPDIDEVALAEHLRALEARYKAPFAQPNEDMLAGGLANTIAGRICNHFDLKGGGFSVDGACSSSLLAVTDACTALVMGDADMVLAGGVDLSLDPFELVGFSRTSALARTEMRVYDEHSEGFWPGEGCGFVALMRLQDALEQCEDIHAVISGWGISSDGRGGLTRPEVDGQRLALSRAYRRAGYGIDTVGYFEGHGTGTRVGDETELTAVIGERAATGVPLRPAVISSIKANIGHTKAAAGIAGLLRAAKALKHGVLPPTTACHDPHPLFAKHGDNLRPAFRTEDWDPARQQRRAGVSAMGFGGINTHITLTEPPQSQRTTVPVTLPRARFDTAQDCELFLFAANTAWDLGWTIDHVAGIAPECSRAELGDLAVELGRRAARDSAFRWRAAVVAATPAELAEKLAALKALIVKAEDDSLHLDTEQQVFLSAARHKGVIGFLFSGQGAPARCHGGIHARRFAAVEAIYRGAGLQAFGQRSDTDFAQPAIATASAAGIATLARLGIDADLAIGHSLGELAALHWAGCYDAAGLIKLATRRGAVMAADDDARGAMAAVAADAVTTAAAIQGISDVQLANINSARQTVISGTADAVAKAAGTLRNAALATTVLTVQRAFHSPAMTGSARHFASDLKDIAFAAPARPVISTVTGQTMAANCDLAQHLTDQITAPVRFLDAVQAADSGVDLFIEVGPGRLLTNLVGAITDTSAVTLDIASLTLRPFLTAAGASYTLGRADEIGALFSDRFARRFDWDWTPDFIANPCETVPAAPETAPERALAEDAVAGSVIADADLVGMTAVAMVRAVVAQKTGLPPFALEDSARMLSDLHLNSITVSDIVTQVSAAMGLPLLVDPTEYADATIGQIAASLDDLKASAPDCAEQAFPVGVGPWVHSFRLVGVPTPRPAPQPRGNGDWQVFASDRIRAGALAAQLVVADAGAGVLVDLGPMPGPKDAHLLLQACQAVLAGHKAGRSLRLVALQDGWGGGGFLRSFFVEVPDCDVLLLNLPVTQTAPDPVLAEIRAAGAGFHEVTLHADGRRTAPVWQLAASNSNGFPPLTAQDTVLVSGGGKGIGAECGFQLARTTGCALLLLGRSRPDDDEELQRNLDRIAAAKLRVSYQVADVTDPAAVAGAVRRGAADLGATVTGVIHAAGQNRPHSVANLDPNLIAETLAPKVEGLRNILRALDPDALKLLVGFGSIIARIGLHGEADYALANEWLSHQIETFGAAHPQCRATSLEWSVWSGTGMGQKLGRLDALMAKGIQPVSVDQGIAAFLRLATGDGPTGAIVVSGRFGAPATVNLGKPPAPALRFVEKIAVWYPGTEIVTECRIGSETDPYIDDHVLNGQRLFPAVMALEAIACALRTLTGDHAAAPNFGRVHFRQGIIVPEDAGLTVRVAVQARADGRFDAAIRCSATGFQVNHVEAVCDLSATAAVDVGFAPVDAAAPGDGLDPARALYGNVLFQKGVFARVAGYGLIEARRCSATLSASGGGQWFAGDAHQTQLLGDAGARDAALHAIQACIPHEVVIPVSVDAIRVAALDPAHAYRIAAVEREDLGNRLVYDMAIFDDAGHVVEFWQRLTLRVMGEPDTLQLDMPHLVAPFVERKIAAELHDAMLTVALSRCDRRRAAGVRRPDGKPDPDETGTYLSNAYSAGWRLSVRARWSVGADLQEIPDHDRNGWTRLIGADGMRLADSLGQIEGIDDRQATTHVWTAREAMKKAGLPVAAPLTVDPASTGKWLRMRSGGWVVFSTVFSPDGAARPLCLAVVVGVAKDAVGLATLLARE